MSLIIWQLLIKMTLSVTKSRFMSVILMKIHYEKSNGFFRFCIDRYFNGCYYETVLFQNIVLTNRTNLRYRLLYITILLLMVCSIPRIKPTQILNKNTVPLAVTTRHGIWYPARGFRALRIWASSMVARTYREFFVIFLTGRGEM